MMGRCVAASDGEHGPWWEAGAQVPLKEGDEPFWFCARCGDVAEDEPRGHADHPKAVLA